MGELRVGLITGNPGHPLLAAAAGVLERRGCRVEAVPLDGGVPRGVLADVYLLKARTPQALALAGELERLGAAVVNSAAATGLCQDRVRMASLARGAGLPFAATVTAGPLGELADQVYPFVVKSRHSRRHDLVALVDGAERLRELAERWPHEEVVTQPYLRSSGWDQKLWVVDGQVFAARRRSELSVGDDGVGAAQEWEPSARRAALALRVGEVFGLEVYGVDLLDGADEPVIVDVNAFPGARGRAGAPEALAGLALRVAAERGRVPV
ncbi:RimK family alpha-L-glutamate ligase [Kitasatospora sp. NPDC001309]|uniref:ATP-grasp domain-containing protein n=1 Tax=Kitasatospora sp. NPDC001309 TaxID=3364013 RepID=UPI003688DFB4